jgi:hypothetical protein
MASVGLGKFLEGLRVMCADTEDNQGERIVGRRGNVIGSSENLQNGEIHLQVQLEDEQQIRPILARNLVRE